MVNFPRYLCIIWSPYRKWFDCNTLPVPHTNDKSTSSRPLDTFEIKWPNKGERVSIYLIKRLNKLQMLLTYIWYNPQNPYNSVHGLLGNLNFGTHRNTLDKEHVIRCRNNFQGGSGNAIYLFAAVLQNTRNAIYRSLE